MNKLNLLVVTPFCLVHEDYPSAYIPAMWANESIAILEENMVIGNLVYRDFENYVKSYGDTVNTRKPGEFKAKRKSSADSVTVQANTATNVAVVLNQHLHTSFIIKDADASKAFKDLVTEYLSPAVLSIARSIDLIVGGQVHQFLPNAAGHLGGMTSDNADDYLLDTRQVLNTNKAPGENRNLILGTVSETTMLKDSMFTQAYSVGDDGSAMREAHLGRKFGFDVFMAQNQPYVVSGTTTTTGLLINHSGGYGIGATALTVDGLSSAVPSGAYITIAGDDTPLRVVSSTGGSTPTAILISTGLRSAVADNAAITIYAPAAVNNSSGYAIGYDKDIIIDTNTPEIGQMVTFGTSNTTVYTIIDVDSGAGTITLDRPLEQALADDDAVNLGPPGSYNLAFSRNAIALVCRPLALPIAGTGARAGVINHNGLSIRVVMTYDGNQQGTLVTVDTLLGVKVLDKNLGAVLLG